MKAKKILVGTLVVLTTILVGSFIYYDNESLQLDKLNSSQLEGDFIDLTEGRTYYELTGPKDGEVVVLVHGFSVPSYIWQPTKGALLEAGYQVLAFDLFGRGYSDRPDSDYGMALYVQQLYDLLNALNLKDKVNIVGLSMGGPVVTHFVNKYPQNINKVSLIAPLIETPSKGILALLKIPLLGDYLAKVRVVPMLLNGLERVVYDPSVFPNWKTKFEDQTRYKGFAQAIVKTAIYLDGKSFVSEYDAFGKLDIPTQLFWGKQDQTIPFTDSVKVMNALGQVEFIPLDKTGHLPHYEQATLVNSNLISFLNQ